jgi:predicted restriction endonuclease
MSQEKKKIRENFRNSCFKRDKYRCVTCKFQSSKEKAEQELDAHHVYSRDLMVGGGYVASNGISLCQDCHIKAEEFWSTGTAAHGFSVEELYKLIGSSYELAVRASEKLK